MYERSFEQKQKEAEQHNVREFFMNQYGNHAQVRVEETKGRYYDTSVDSASIKEDSDGNLTFVLKVTVSGTVKRFESDRPDTFDGLELLSL